MKIDWPGLDRFLRPNLVDWLFKPDVLDISRADQRVLDQGAISAHSDSTFPRQAFRGLSPDVAAYHMYFADPTTLNKDSFVQMMRYRVVVVSGNRGIVAPWLQQIYGMYGWPRGAPNMHREFYTAVFDSLFIPSTECLSMSVPLLDGRSIMLQDMLKTISNTRSFVLQYRVSDDALQDGCDKRTAAPLEGNFIESLCQRQIEPNDTLVLLSNSECAMRSTHEYFQSRKLNMTVFMPGGNTGIHIDSRLKSTEDKTVFALKATLRDLLLMRASQVIFAQHRSGFPAAAAIITLKTRMLDCACRELPQIDCRRVGHSRYC